jgi:hypothetical protein
MKITHALFACAAAAVGVNAEDLGGINGTGIYAADLDCAATNTGVTDAYFTYITCTAAGGSDLAAVCDCADDWKVDLDAITECTVPNDLNADATIAACDRAGASSSVSLSFAAAIAVVVGYVAVN